MQHGCKDEEKGEIKAVNQRRGGKRLGAGRKAAAVKVLQRELIDTVNATIAPQVARILKNLFALADGIMVRQETKDGPTIYSQPPDRQANIYLLDRVIGKPTEPHTVSGPEGGPIDLAFQTALDDIYGKRE